MGDLRDIEPIRELVYRNLRERIVAGQFEYGSRLKETDIAEELGVSRTPVREAFRKLELEGLVRSLNRRGVVVTNLEVADLGEIYALREVLEGLAARLAATQRTEEESLRFSEIAAQMEEAYHQSDLVAFSQIHSQYNDLLYQMSRQRRLIEVLSRYNEYIEKSQLISMRLFGRGDEIIDEHRAIVEAIDNQDPDLAESLTRYHIHRAATAFYAAHSSQKAGGTKTKDS